MDKFVHNPYIQPLLTDLYQLTMAYAYFNSGKHEENAVFDLFFRKNPFGGEFTVFAGLDECLSFLDRFKFSDEDIAYLRRIMPEAQPAFFDWLLQVDCSQLKVYACPEGTVSFPRIPLLRVEGPLAVTQLLETTLLNLVNFASLIATNAARFRIAAGYDKTLLEFGARRAQGPDGAVSASRYAFVGGFDGTSNVLVGKMFNIDVRGTHAHSFVTSYCGLDDIKDPFITVDEKKHNLVEAVLKARKELDYETTNDGELASFISYAQAFPSGFLALVDTYDTLHSGVPNFLCVAVALGRIGLRAVGIRLDSGDLAYLSIKARELFQEAEQLSGILVSQCKIVASNDINEATLLSLGQQGHSIDTFGIGTHLVTCQAQPALGCVYKLVEINNEPRIKLSQEITKVTIPGRKTAYRLIGPNDNMPFMDVMMKCEEEAPTPGKRLLCRHPFNEVKRAYATPSKVVNLHQLVWDGKFVVDRPSIHDIKSYVVSQIKYLRQDHTRPLNPTPYKVSVSSKLYEFMHDLWLKEAPIMELSES